MADRRVARTCGAVESAFAELLEERGYAAVTVAALLERANVGKSTFYTHYQGKEDLLEALMARVTRHVLAPGGPEEGHDFDGRDDFAGAVEHLLRHLRSCERDVRALLLGGADGAFDRHLRTAMTRFLDGAVPAHLAGPAAAVGRPFLLAHLTGALVQLFVDWAYGGFADDPAALARDYAALAEPLFR